MSPRTKAIPKDRHGLRTEQAKRALIRCIRDGNLKAGDRMPPQSDICGQLGLGKATILRAMNALKADGVLKTRRRVGMYVVDPEAEGHAGRVIGLAAHRAGDPSVGPFYASLLHHLQSGFQTAGCQTLVFYAKPTRGAYGVGLDYFPGLRRCVEENRVDAVMLTADIDRKAWDWLEARGKHPCFVGAPTALPAGVFVDLESGAAEATAELIARGCKRPAVAIAPGAVREFVWPGFRRAARPLPGFKPQRFYFTGMNIPGGHQIAEEILARPRGERPDGLAIMDDQIAMGLVAHLIRARSVRERYAPMISCLCNRDMPIDLPVDHVIRWEIAAADLAAQAVALALRRIRGNRTGGEKIWLKPRRAAEGSIFAQGEQIPRKRRLKLETPVSQ